MTPINNFNFNNFVFSTNPFIGSLNQDIFSAVQTANMQGLFSAMNSFNFSSGINPFSSFNFSNLNFSMLVMPAVNFPTFNFSNFATSTYGASATVSRPSLTGRRVQDALRLAESQIGVREQTGHNDGAQIDVYRNGRHNGAAWCASFVSWCYGQGQNTDNSTTFGYDASSQSIRKKAQKAGFYQTVQSGYVPQVGDIAVWDNGDGTGHVGIVSKVNDDGSFETIDGNYSDQVRRVRRTRSSQNLSGFVQMNEWIAANESGSRTSLVA